MNRTVVALVVVLALAGRVGADEDPLACPPPSPADARAREALAQQRYVHGQELHDRGDYEAAIPEFRAAYCLAPAAEPVFNVALAYERLVDYQRAVAWFDAYLRMVKRTASNRGELAALENHLRVLRRLPARIRVATEPPGATISLEGPEGRTSGQANTPEPLKVQAGTYTMRIELSGYVPVEETVTAEIGQPYTYSYRLAAQTGLLRVTTSPSNARILLDDRVVATGRFAGQVPVGEHLVTVEAELRPPETRTVMVAVDRETRVQVAMKPARPRNGKIELVIASTALGILEGGVFMTAYSKNKPLIGGVAVAVGALGFLAPYLFLPHEVPTGQTSLMIGGRIWGGLEGLALAGSIWPESGTHRKEWSSLFAGGSLLAGIGAGFLAPHLDISAGDAALVNSGGLWGTSTALLLRIWLNPDNQNDGPILLAGLNVGLLAGAILTTQLEPSRGRIFLIDVSGLAGAISGVALATLLEENDQGVGGFALGGMAIGLGVGALVTRGIDDDDDVTPSTTVVEDAARRPTPVVGLSGRW